MISWTRQRLRSAHTIKELNNLKLSIPLTRYRASLQVIKVRDRHNAVIGTLQRFHPNQVVERIGRHITSALAANVRVHMAETEEVYTVQLTSSLRAVLSAASWTITRDSSPIGTVNERAVGRTLRVETYGEQLLLTSRLGSLREITCYRETEGARQIVGQAKRSPSLTKPSLTLTVQEERTVIPPMLLAAICLLHQQRGRG